MSFLRSVHNPGLLLAALCRCGVQSQQWHVTWAVWLYCLLYSLAWSTSILCCRANSVFCDWSATSKTLLQWAFRWFCLSLFISFSPQYPLCRTLKKIFALLDSHLKGTPLCLHLYQKLKASHQNLHSLVVVISWWLNKLYKSSVEARQAR